MAEVQEARAAEARAATQAEAEEEVGRWLGGPYSIPTYIVMCESGGNYSALNPSSGAGGAYQILPSTWELYGGQGAPEASKEEQDRIAAEIWADSGGGAWVCALAARNPCRPRPPVRVRRVRLGNSAKGSRNSPVPSASLGMIAATS